MNDYNAPADLLRDKVILITGAGDGIGAQAAKTYAAHGAICILLGRTVSKLEAVYDDIVAAGGQETRHCSSRYQRRNALSLSANDANHY